MFEQSPAPTRPPPPPWRAVDRFSSWPGQDPEPLEPPKSASIGKFLRSVSLFERPSQDRGSERLGRQRSNFVPGLRRRPSRASTQHGSRSFFYLHQSRSETVRSFETHVYRETTRIDGCFSSQTGRDPEPSKPSKRASIEKFLCSGSPFERPRLSIETPRKAPR